MEWFKEYDHIGYDLLGRKIAKPKTGDELDEFLEKNDNPDYWFVELLVCHRFQQNFQETRTFVKL